MKRALILMMFIGCFNNFSQAESLEIPLYKLAPVETINLKCVKDEFVMPISIPKRWDIRNLTLNFGYVNSTAILKSRSRLIVRLNGYPVAQISLDPDAPEGNVKVALPILFLSSGYNELKFFVTQHYTTEACEEQCAPELWTTLRLKDAYLNIEYDLKTVPLELSEMDTFLFDPKILPYGRVNIISEDLSAESVSLASIVASGIALKFDYRKVVFDISHGIRSGMDNVVIGKNGFIKDFLKKERKGPISHDFKGPLLKIMHLPFEGDGKDRTNALIVISGDDFNQVKLACETMAILSFPFPNVDEITPIKYKVPDIEPYSGRQMLEADKKYTIDTLGLNTHTFMGKGAIPKHLQFRLPPDFFIKQNLYADLSLYFAYGAGMTNNAALNILINGKHVRAIHLDNEDGAFIEGYKISFPTYFFKSGANTITFRPILIPSIPGNCEHASGGELFFTLFENSELYFPSMPHRIKLPELKLFFLNGFPMTRWPDGFEAMVYITQKDVDTISAALNTIGSISQKNGFSLLNLEVVLKKPDFWDGELLIIGDINTIPDEINKIAPMNLSTRKTVPNPIVKSWKKEPSLAYIEQISRFGKNKGVLMQFESPYKVGRSIILITANSNKELRTFSEVLLEPSVGGQCKGDVAIVNLKSSKLDKLDYEVVSLEVGDKYHSGKKGEITEIESYLFSLDKLYFVISGLLILFLGLTIYYLARRYRKRRLKGG